MNIHFFIGGLPSLHRAMLTTRQELRLRLVQLASKKTKILQEARVPYELRTPSTN